MRFQLHDASGVQQSTVEAIPGVMGAVPQAGDRYQVVIGGGVQNVYNDIRDCPASAPGQSRRRGWRSKAAARARGPRGPIAWLDTFFEFWSDSVPPILPAPLGASLFITFMALMSTLHVIPELGRPAPSSPSWQSSGT